MPHDRHSNFSASSAKRLIFKHDISKFAVRGRSVGCCARDPCGGWPLLRRPLLRDPRRPRLPRLPSRQSNHWTRPTAAHRRPLRRRRHRRPLRRQCHRRLLRRRRHRRPRRRNAPPRRKSLCARRRLICAISSPAGRADAAHRVSRRASFASQRLGDCPCILLRWQERVQRRHTIGISRATGSAKNCSALESACGRAVKPWIARGRASAVDSRVYAHGCQHDLDVLSEQPRRRCHLLVTKMNETASAPSGRVQRVLRTIPSTIGLLLNRAREAERRRSECARVLLLSPPH
jgi:hypothetical protein